jgi:hypothetical protein
MIEHNLFTVMDQQEKSSESKRLVGRNYMTGLMGLIYTELKNHLTKDNAIKAVDLAEIFDIDTRHLRKVIEQLRSQQNAKIIGDNNGYYIGTKEEFEEWIGMRIKRTLSSVGTTLDLNPGAKKIIFWYLNKIKKTELVPGQTQIQFNGWEREFIRQFAEDYLKSDSIDDDEAESIQEEIKVLEGENYGKQVLYQSQ